MGDTRKLHKVDADGDTTVELQTSGAEVSEDNPLPVTSIENTHTFVNRRIHRSLGTGNTLAVAVVPTDYQATVVDGSVYSVGDTVEIGDGTRENTHLVITVIATNVLTFDRQIDYAHAIGADVGIIGENMRDAVGSMASPISYKVHVGATETLHIYRMMVAMTDNTAGDLGTFGGIGALTNGCTVRAFVGGVYFTFTNWKTNGDMKLDFFDVEFDTRSGGGPGPGGGGNRRS